MEEEDQPGGVQESEVQLKWVPAVAERVEAGPGHRVRAAQSSRR